MSLSLEEFLRFAQAIPDPILLVGASGDVVGSNSAAQSLLGRQIQNVSEVVPQGNVTEMLRMMSRSPEPVAAGVSVRLPSGESLPYRCDGALLRSSAGGEPPLLSLRFRPRDASSARFVELNSRLEGLDGEVRTRRRAESLIHAQVATLELILSGRPLDLVLEQLVRTLESDAIRPILGSILLYDRTTGQLRHGAAPNLPAAYTAAIDGLQAGEGVGSCGTAAHRGATVIVSDIATDPLWKDYRELALTHNLHACWSTPILSSTNEVLGTFAMYRTEPGAPLEREMETVSLLTRTASIAIERAMADAQRAELHRRERLARAEAESANRIKDEFLATVSHELRTPLTAIIGWSRLLRQQLHGAEDVEAIDAIESSARAQAQIIEDLLDFSRIAADRMKIEHRPVDLAAVVAEAVATVRPTAEANGVTIESSVAPLSRVLGDPDRLRQVIWNLLTNAIKFSPGGHVEIRVSAVDGSAAIAVTDNGEGIAPDFLPRIFDRFSQSESGARKKHGGLGLGLSIVRRIVELHGGQITACSDGAGRGATFRVSIPLAPAPGLNVEPVTPVESRERPTLAGVSVLLVEDDDASRIVIRRMLESAGAQVCATRSAAEALDAFATQPPQVVVSDIAMPTMNGYQLMRLLRQEEVGHDFAAVALTAFTRPADRENAFASGFDEHLGKPLDPEALVETIRRALGRRDGLANEQRVTSNE